MQRSMYDISGRYGHSLRHFNLHGLTPHAVTTQLGHRAEQVDHQVLGFMERH